MYVFRDGKRIVSGDQLQRSLCRELRRAESDVVSEPEDRILAALIAAGELECALLDAEDADSDSRRAAAEITEVVAAALLSGDRSALPAAQRLAEQLHMPSCCHLATQEGFAYYALHPCKIAMLLESLPMRPEMAVLGIRSIGVTLSAVVLMALRVRGISCRRINVRPEGHPYERTLKLTDELCRWVDGCGQAGFLVVDEGPGISGSSFLAVAEGLEACGVEPHRICLMGSRAVQAHELRAPDAARRWPRFTFKVMQSAPLPPEQAGESLSGGSWRRIFRDDLGPTPASWASLEPAKFLSRDGHSLFRFEGFGHYGEGVGRRARKLAWCGFSPRYLGNHRGFGEYQLRDGQRLHRSDCTAELISRIAVYLALRSRAFACSQNQSSELETMLDWNWKLEFGEELGSHERKLAQHRVVLCDGRMMPHEWLRTEDGELLKLDAVTHGDDHFFPGPCDIAWDVAGAIVEWELEGDARASLLDDYQARTGDAVRQRLAPYLLAYATFRLGWCKMAALAMAGEFDQGLLERDYRRYRAFAMRLRQPEPRQAEPKRPEPMQPQKTPAGDLSLRAS